MTEAMKDMAMAQRVLVLNASYEPHQVISVRRALVLVLQRKAELIEARPNSLRAERTTFERPKVIRLMRYIALPKRSSIACTRRGVFVRDRDTCQYCGARPGRASLTIDHIVPRSRGGGATWDNLVAACQHCNHRKGGRTPEEAGLQLRSQPCRPHARSLAFTSDIDHEWAPYLAAASTD